MVTERSLGNSKQLDLANFSCPVCGETFDGLKKLNKHLDVDHGFNDGTAEITKITDRSSKGSKTQHIIRTHWEQDDFNRALCRECGISFKKASGLINCRKCGYLFCNLHCRNIIKLNLKAEYDPFNGKWYACCYGCFSGKPGYNDYGTFVDITDSFAKVRDIKNEDESLRTLQLENRLIRLIDGIVDIHQKYRGSIFMNLSMRSETSKLERTVAPWRNDKSVLDCSICLRPFGLTLRKHHCRLCGKVVCNRDATNCSSEVSIQSLANAAKDLPFEQKAVELVKIDCSVRLCYNCVKSLYAKRKFRKDLQKPKGKLLLLCESIQSNAQVINVTIAQMEGFLEKMDDSKTTDNLPKQEDMSESKRLRTKLLRSVAMYNSLTRQISEVRPANPTEAKIKRSVQLASSTFINEKILRLKTLPGMDESAKNSAKPFEPQKISSNDLLFNNLTISEVKRYREELMVLNEQKFLVQSMMDDAKKQRKFDEIAVLASNLNELTAQIGVTQKNLGDLGFF